MPAVGRGLKRLRSRWPNRSANGRPRKCAVIEVTERLSAVPRGGTGRPEKVRAPVRRSDPLHAPAVSERQMLTSGRSAS